MSEFIRLFITGGTFDKEYDERTGNLFFKDTHLRDMLKSGRCLLNVEIRTLMMVDSLEMDDEDREVILSQCRKCDPDRIVITHGTDTMETTARLLGENITDKTIVLTGAMIPMAFGSSDGFFNLGSALAFAQSLDPGVYIAMNGRYFTWDNVRKNRDAGIFEELI
jgi:L-asparaginase